MYRAVFILIDFLKSVQGGIFDNFWGQNLTSYLYDLDITRAVVVTINNNKITHTRFWDEICTNKEKTQNTALYVIKISKNTALYRFRPA